MVKPEWGTKRTCPKCGERFYDLGNDDPVTCINEECGVEWTPEPVLKSKQPVAFDDKEDKKKKDDSDLSEDDEDLDIDEDGETNPDDEVDLGGDDDIQVDTSAGDDEKDDS
ncbi:TIGR02300 family protein [uncultured Parasphingopyxis sp.]|uniref:TIGR02300 family protein n=1 Tax=uncultured Parasphingopyxis sp. TaxID=1547918 RepID=UPI0026394229|nr:TIGR02300 family protein [uncultured Parasphingopyxis sp.]